MMTPIELSPIDQIRQVEVEQARRVITSRDAAKRTIADANAQAAQIKNDARERGKREGRTRYEVIVNRAEDEARAIIAQGQRNAEELRSKGYKRMNFAVHHVLSFVIAIDDELE